MKSSKVLVVLGMMGRCPFGGQTWLYINWLRGLHKLGHRIFYVEDDLDWPYDPRVNTCHTDPSYTVEYVAGVMKRIGLDGCWAYRPRYRSADECYGMTVAQLLDLYRGCDALLNICGAAAMGWNPDQQQAKRRVLVETDPVGAELEMATGNEGTFEVYNAHDTFVTYGENYGAPDCGVPMGKIQFHKTRQPIDIDLWPYAFDASCRKYTTSGNWKQKGRDLEYNGQLYYWSKHHEFLKFIDLPRRRPGVEFELCMNINENDEADRQLLLEHGWHLDSPFQMSLDPWGYQNYFKTARAEYTCAKDQNVRLRSGWFSERDLCFLSSGKPVIAQETGFSKFIPCGTGLFGFHTMDDILAAVDTIESDYEKACRAAREIAVEHFECERVCRKFMDDIRV
jgi:hypothetical protein